MAQTRRPSASGDLLSPLAFCFVVVLGCGYIVAAKFQHYPAWAVTLAPIGFMLVYAVVVGLVPALRLRLDQAGDNLYYMGFLFTLTSLGVSLYQFRANGPAEEIVQNFGIAVGSTIAGVALRVLFTQMRRDPVDVEQASRLELAEAARRVRRELDGTVLELANFRRSSQQAVIEGFDEVRAGMEDVANRILAAFETLTTQAVKPIENASASSSAMVAALATSVSGSLEAASQRLAAENGRLADGTEQISKALAETAARLAAMQTPDKVIEIKLEPVVSKLAKAVNDFTRRVEGKVQADDALLTAIADTAKGTQELRQALAEMARAVAGTARIVEAARLRSEQQTEQMQAILAVLEAQQREYVQWREAPAGAADLDGDGLSVAPERAFAGQLVNENP